MKMNVERGMKRLTWLFIGLIWVVVLGVAASERDAARALGSATVYLTIFTVFVLLAFRAVAWALRGFRDDSPKA